MIKVFLVLGVTAFLLTIPANLDAAHPCGLRVLFAEADDRVAVDEKRSCLNPDATRRICKVAGEQTRFVFEINGKQVGALPTAVNLGDTDFFLLIGNMDNRPGSEWLVANRDTVSNGIGINYWTLFIIPEPGTAVFSPPIELKVEDFGEHGSFKMLHEGGCGILESRWIWDVVEKHHLYFVGRWLIVSNGNIIPVVDQTIFARQYLLSFEKERLDTLADRRHPSLWLKRGKRTRLPNNWQPPRI